MEHRRPIYLGEFGAYSKADLASRARWTAFVAQQACGAENGLRVLGVLCGVRGLRPGASPLGRAVKVCPACPPADKVASLRSGNAAKAEKSFLSAQPATETYNQAAINGCGLCLGGRFRKSRRPYSLAWSSLLAATAWLQTTTLRGQAASAVRAEETN